MFGFTHLHEQELAVVLVGFIETVRRLVTPFGRLDRMDSRQTNKPLLHADALPIVAGEFSFRAGRKFDPFNLGSHDKDLTNFKFV